MESKSSKFKINWDDVWKTARGTLITVAGFAVVIVGQVLVDIDLGFWNIMAAPIAGGLIELGRRLMRDYSPVELKE